MKTFAKSIMMGLLLLLTSITSANAADNYEKIKNNATGLLLTVLDNNDVEVRKADGSDSQLWKFVDIDNGFIKFLSKKNGKALYSTGIGNNITVADYKDSDKFKFKKVEIANKCFRIQNKAATGFLLNKDHNDIMMWRTPPIHNAFTWFFDDGRVLIVKDNKNNSKTKTAAKIASLKGLKFYPNFNTISVYVYKTDAESGEIEYRLKGSAKWLPAHKMIKITSEPGKKNGAADLAGAIFYLQPATEYEVKVTLPDGKILTDTVSTRYDLFPAKGKIVKVSDAKALQKAVQNAVPGDVIEVAPGTYNLTLKINRKIGKADNYIKIISKEKGKAILDSSDPNFAAGKGGWKDEGNGIYSKAVTPARKVHCIWWNKRRLYQFFSKKEFDRQIMVGHDKKEYPFKAKTPYYSGSCVYDNGRLYVKLPDKANPDKLGVHVPMLDRGIYINESQFIVIDGFTVRHYGIGYSETNSTGIMIRRSGNSVFRNLTIYGSNTCLRYEDWPQTYNNIGYDNNTFEYNHFFDNGPTGVTWDLYKKRPPDWECNLTKRKLGRGTVFRYNQFHGSFGGVDNGALGDGNTVSPYLSGDMDVNNNLFYDIIDDAIEPDGGCSNLRIWHNEFYRVHHPISPAPNTIGPLWIIRNAAFQKEGGVVDFFSFVKQSRFWDKNYQGQSLIYHNTLFNSGKSGMILCRCDDGKNMNFRNNIMAINAVRPTQVVLQIFSKEHYTFDYDLIYKFYKGDKSDKNYTRIVQYYSNKNKLSAYGLQEIFEKLGYEKHGIFADPLFVGGEKPQTLDGFKLKEDSPAIDKALNIPNISAGWNGFAGAGPDIGAFEHGKNTKIGQ